MIFRYDELKKYVWEDFERFYNLGFDEEQLFPAVLSEYKSGGDFCRTEYICVCIFLIFCYQKKKFDFPNIIEKLKRLLTEEAHNEAQITLGDECRKYLADLDRILKE